MSVIIVTGSSGLVGSECVKFYCQKGHRVIGIDNNMREFFFGKDASTLWMKEELLKNCKNFRHFDTDIRDFDGISKIFKEYKKDISLIIHSAAQPSHDWAAMDPFTDFTVNASGTLNLLEAFRHICPEAVFIFVSTNKVYGDLPNYLPLKEHGKRFEIEESHKWHKGIDETMSLDQTKHSLFGVSKAAADLMTQEYGRYFCLKTGIFRGGCLTGPSHSGTRLHGFLSYLMRCAITGNKYYIYGYKGKQVRDNIHSYDLVNAFNHFFEKPGSGEVYNMGGSRHSNISITEAVDICEEITGKKMNIEYIEENRIGDHIWWISDVSKFKNHYPCWDYHYNCREILKEIYDIQKNLRW